jgi:hypothetical protein
MKKRAVGRSFKHTWEYEYCYDEGCCFNITATLELCYEPAIGKYIVSERGADSSVGRHWNPHGRPDATFSSYQEALHEYLKLAGYYAPSHVIKRIRIEVEEELDKWSNNGSTR